METADNETMGGLQFMAVPPLSSTRNGIAFENENQTWKFIWGTVVGANFREENN